MSDDETTVENEGLDICGVWEESDFSLDNSLNDSFVSVTLSQPVQDVFKAPLPKQEHFAQLVREILRRRLASTLTWLTTDSKVGRK